MQTYFTTSIYHSEFFQKEKKQKKFHQIEFLSNCFFSEIPTKNFTLTFFVNCYDFRKQFHEKNTRISFAIKLLVKENNRNSDDGIVNLPSRKIHAR